MRSKLFALPAHGTPRSAQFTRLRAASVDPAAANPTRRGPRPKAITPHFYNLDTSQYADVLRARRRSGADRGGR